MAQRLLVDFRDGFGPRDYTNFLQDADQFTSHELNKPALFDFILTPCGDLSDWKAPTRGVYLRLEDDTWLSRVKGAADGVLFTGYFNSDPDLVQLGLGPSGEDVWSYRCHVTSEDYLANIKALPQKTYINKTRGFIIRDLLSEMFGGSVPYSLENVHDGGIERIFQVNTAQKFTDLVFDFAKADNFTYYVIDGCFVYSPQGSFLPNAHDPKSRLVIDRSDPRYTPDNLSLTHLAGSVVNDVTVVGNTEPTNVVRESFISDGYSGYFPLAFTPFGAVESSLLKDDFTSDEIDDSIWTESDEKVANYIREFEGSLNVIGGRHATSAVANSAAAGMTGIVVSSDLHSTEHLTIMARVKPGLFVGTKDFFALLDTSWPSFAGNFVRLGTNSTGRTLKLEAKVGASDLSTTSVAVDPDKWYDLLLTKDDTDLSVYLIESGRQFSTASLMTLSMAADFVASNLALVIPPLASVTNYKVWRDVLTSAEMDLERATTRALRSDRLWIDAPLQNANDISNVSGQFVTLNVVAELVAELVTSAGPDRPTSGSVFLRSRQGIELSGVLHFRDGELQFPQNPSGVGILGGLYTEAGDEMSEADLICGWKLDMNAGVLYPVGPDGVEEFSGLTINPALDYVLRKQITVDKSVRNRNTYYSNYDDFHQAFSADAGAPANCHIYWYVDAIDISDPNNVVTTTIPVLTKNYSEVKDFAVYCPIVSYDLHVVMNYVEIFKPQQALVTVDGAPIRVGNALDGGRCAITLDGGPRLAWYALPLPSQNSRAATTPEDVVTIPPQGAVVEVMYWAADKARARVISQAAVTQERIRFKDDGVRQFTLQPGDIKPVPNTTEECYALAQAWLADRILPRYEGSYTIEVGEGSPTELNYWIYPGDHIPVYIELPNDEVIDQRLIVSTVKTAFQGKGCYQIIVSFGAPERVAQAIRQLVMKRASSIENASIQDVDSITTEELSQQSLPEDPTNWAIESVTTTAFTVNMSNRSSGSVSSRTASGVMRSRLSNFPLDNLTMMGWFYIVSGPHTELPHDLLVLSDSDTIRGNSYIAVGTDTGGVTPLLKVHDAGLGVDHIFNSAGNISFDGWYNFAYVKNGSNHKLYLTDDAGVIVAETVYESSFSFSMIVRALFSTNQNTNTTGIKMWKEALTRDEVIAETKKRSAVHTSGLVLEAHLASLADLNDRSGNHADFALVTEEPVVFPGLAQMVTSPYVPATLGLPEGIVGYEVRNDDSGWGQPNYVTRWTGTPRHTFTRNKRDQYYYIRPFDSDGEYSRRSAVVRVVYPLPNATVLTGADVTGYVSTNTFTLIVRMPNNPDVAGIVVRAGGPAGSVVYQGDGVNTVAQASGVNAIVGTSQVTLYIDNVSHTGSATYWVALYDLLNSVGIGYTATITQPDPAEATSIGLSLPAEFDTGGAPVVGSGTLTAGWADQAANRFLASPNGSSGQPTFRAIVNQDLPVLDATKIPSLDASKILTGVLAPARGGTNSAFVQFAGPTTLRTFTLPDASCTLLSTSAAVTAAQGGTGQTSYSKGDMLAATATALAKVPAGANGQTLVPDSSQTAGVKWINGVFVLERTLTDSELRGMFASPISLVSAPGSAFVLIPLSLTITTDFSAGAYGQDNAFTLGHGSGSTLIDAVTGVTNTTTKKLVRLQPTSGAVNTSGASNQPLSLSNATSALTGGNAANTAKLSLQYIIAPAA